MYNFIIGLYALVVRLISPFHRKARLMVKGHKAVYRKLRKEIYTNAKYIWLHAASLGEFEQGRPIIEYIKENYPNYKILLTFFSPSGYEVRKDYELADIVCYLPFDKKRNVKKFIKLANPHIAIFIKYEFWYNYINRLHKKGIPTYMVSAIFRPNQFFFKWYGKPYQKMLRYYNCICVQDANSEQLLASIGVDSVKLCGDTRFDRVIDIRSRAKELPIADAFTYTQEGTKQLTLVAGSSWPKDEDIFVNYFNSNPELKLIIAPHEIHEAHLSYIESILKRPSIRYSKVTDKNDLKSYDCLIVDTFGLLSSLYRYGEIAYVGGGFGVGIHNILEAAVYGVPVIFGPNFKKFREANQLIEAGGGYSIHNEDSFLGLMDEFIQYPEVLHSAGDCAGKYVSENAGVVQKVIRVIEKNL